MAMEVAPVNEALPTSYSIVHEKSIVAGVDGSPVKDPAASLCIENLDGNGEQQVPGNNSLPSPDHCKQISEALEEAEMLFRKGSDALNDYQFQEAVDCLSKALEIRVKHHGDFAPECLSTYYQCGRALFCKSLEDYDPSDEDESVPKMGDTSDIAYSATPDVHGEAAKTCEVPATNTVKSSAIPAHGDTSATSDIKETPQASQTLANTAFNGNASDQNEGGKDEEQDIAHDDDGIEVESEEEEVDVDLAWKMFDIIRVILERNQQDDDTFRMVEVYTALGDVSLERENFETSFQDYCKALSYLEGAVRSDSRHIAELCYKICVALECDDKVIEALNYGQRAVSVCESRLHRIRNKILTLSNHGKASSNKVNSYSREMGVITQLLIDYKEKVDELQHLASNPLFIERVPLSEGKNGIDLETNLCIEDIFMNRFDSPTKKVKTTSFSSPSIIDLGIVGRGIKSIRIPVLE